MHAKALILCAGLGTRLHKYTQTTPKPLLPVCDRPILEYTLRHLASLGITDIGINLHYKGEQIRERFADGASYGIRITYVEEEAPSGTAGAVKRFESFLADVDAFFVLYGDVLTNQNFQDVLCFHQAKQALGTVVLHKRAQSNSLVTMNEEGRIVQFLERPSPEVLQAQKSTEASWVNSGLYCFSPKILEQIPAHQFADLPKDIFPTLLAARGLWGFPLVGKRWSIDTEERLLEANHALQNQTIFSFAASGERT